MGPRDLGVVYMYHPSLGEAKTGGTGAGGQSLLHSEDESSLCYMAAYLKKGAQGERKDAKYIIYVPFL